jgi:hypothetical protein
MTGAFAVKWPANSNCITIILTKVATAGLPVSMKKIDHGRKYTQISLTSPPNRLHSTDTTKRSGLSMTLRAS